jgi:5-methylcytosine-specific restriction protein B
MLPSEQGYQFFIPTNIYLIGTMNTIDRSVESFDFALRRRFSWQEVSPDIRLLKFYLSEHCSKWIELANSLEKLNENIKGQALLGNDYQIGHAYVMNLKYPKSLSLTEVKVSIWEDSIRPLLQEYLRGTGEEVELIRSFSKSFGV